MGALAVIALGCGILAGPARADGDPASDVLAVQSLFLPQDAGIAVTQQVQLERLVEESARSGYPLRVAVIASSTDLGSVTELWRQPAIYSRFLGQELSLTYRGVLLVIMPNGFGVSHQGQSLAAGQAALSGVAVHGAGAGLATTALDAVRRLAAASGRSLPLPAAAAPRTSRPSDVATWIAFAVGLVLVTAAWTASLRARPIRGGRRDVPAP